MTKIQRIVIVCIALGLVVASVNNLLQTFQIGDLQDKINRLESQVGDLESRLEKNKEHNDVATD